MTVCFTASAAWGQELSWLKRYDSGFGLDFARGVACDSFGNSYVIGAQSMETNLLDLALVKYDRAGEIQWVRSYDGPAHLDDVGRCVAVWENGGQIYIYAAGTRETSANGDNMDWVVLKYKADGSLDENGWPGGTGFEQSYAPTNALVLKGQYNAGTLKSLRQDDWDYWVQEAGYDPSDPLAVINSALLCETEAANPAYGSGKVKVVEHTYTEKAKFRMRAIKADGSYVVLADNVPSGFQDVVIERDFPQPVLTL